MNVAQQEIMRVIRVEYIIMGYSAFKSIKLLCMLVLALDLQSLV